MGSECEYVEGVVAVLLFVGGEGLLVGLFGGPAAGGVVEAEFLGQRFYFFGVVVLEHVFYDLSAWGGEYSVSMEADKFVI